jgi:hypothetical protein
MHDLQALIERTQSLQEQVDALRQSAERLQAELRGQADALAKYLPPASASAPAQAKVTGVAAGAHHADESERRTTPRRRGNPVAALVAQPGAALPAQHGWVVDRSPDGVSLILHQETAVGTRFRVRPDHPLVGSNWFEVEVRNCRPERNIWILGCQFTRKLSWSELRLFS